MKTRDVVELLKEGKKPMVRIMGSLWDDGWGQKGMLARIVSYRENNSDGDPMIELMFDYNENKDHNISLQPMGYFLRSVCSRKTGTAFEAGLMKEDNIHEGVYFMLDGKGGDEVPVELVDSPILNLYMKSGSKVPYVVWLESKLEELVPDCMKDWKEGL